MHSRPLDGPFAWRGRDLARDDSWTHALSAAETDEIDAALNRALGRGLPWDAVGRADFALPTLGPRLTRVADELEHGPGVALLRGLPVSRYRDHEPDDIQLLNSHVTYHARTAYEDDPGTPRLLYRLWLCPPGNRALPADHAVLWGNVEAGSLRGGIGQVPAPAAAAAGGD